MKTASGEEWLSSLERCLEDGEGLTAILAFDPTAGRDNFYRDRMRKNALERMQVSCY